MASPIANPLIDVVMFFATAGLAYYLDWQTYDLVWGLWFSSLTVGYSLILVSSCKELLDPEISKAPFLLIIGIFQALFTVAFFTVHFGGFHFGHAVFLNTFFPIHAFDESQDNWAEQIFQFMKMVFLAYWPFALAGFLSKRRAFFAPVSSASVFVPYVNVIKMHLLIFFLIFSKILGLDNRLNYLVVFSIYFFPFGALKSVFFGPKKSLKPLTETKGNLSNRQPGESSTHLSPTKSH